MLTSCANNPDAGEKFGAFLRIMLDEDYRVAHSVAQGMHDANEQNPQIQ